METAALTSRVIKTKLIEWKKLKFIQQEDFKELSPQAREKLKKSIVSNNFTQPFYVWQDPSTSDIYCLDGKHRTLLLEELIKDGVEVPEKLPATFIHCNSKTDAAELVLIYSSIYAKITEQGLSDFTEIYDLDLERMKMTIDLPEFDMIEFESMMQPEEKGYIPQSLTEKFIIPPFSIFDTRQGYWQDLKKEWHKIFNSQESREGVELIAKSGQSSAVYELRNKMRASLGREPEWDEIIAEAKKRKMHIYEGASIFDPVLTEICYRWFCPEGGTILDPFAGGSVRGIVAGILGFAYTGIDLRKEQVLANRQQWSIIEKYSGRINWIVGDSNELLSDDPGSYDFLFSCPPYHDLEHYSDDPADLSNMDYADFLNTYRSIIQKSVDKLKENRFACFVVGDIRDESGFYRNFVSDTIHCFRDAGMELYNEIILINVAGSLPIRVGRQFENSRKVGKMHQNVLVFYKGDPQKIKEEFPEIKVEKYLQELNYQPNIVSSVID